MAIPKDIRYAKNPFLPDLINQSKQVERLGRQYLAKDNNKFMVLNTNTLSSVPVSVFGETKTVEINSFVKLYADGVGGIIGLGNPGKKVFAVLYMQLRSKEGQDKDEITLNYEMIPQELKDYLKLSRATFYRGIRELIKQRFIAYTMAANVYYINPAYLFNGNRLLVMKQYELDVAEETRENFKRLNDKVKTVNVTPEKESREVGLFPPVDQSKVVQLADGRNIDRETGEVLTDANGVQYVDGDLFISEPPDDYETGVIGNNEV